jgi:hypothetical protein
MFCDACSMTAIPDNDACYSRSTETLLSSVIARIHSILEHTRIEEGRDLYPGPGYSA